VNVYVPENLTDKERESLKQMKNSINFTPTKTERKRAFDRFKRMFD
jgi:molecular chaperone DnaJ